MRPAERFTASPRARHRPSCAPGPRPLLPGRPTLAPQRRGCARAGPWAQTKHDAWLLWVCRSPLPLAVGRRIAPRQAGMPGGVCAFQTPDSHVPAQARSWGQQAWLSTPGGLRLSRGDWRDGHYWRDRRAAAGWRPPPWAPRTPCFCVPSRERLLSSSRPERRPAGLLLMGRCFLLPDPPPVTICRGPGPAPPHTTGGLPPPH